MQKHYFVPLTKETGARLYDLLPRDMADAVLGGVPLAAIAACDDEVVLGSAVGMVTEGELLVEYIYVAPKYRRQGIGTALLSALVEPAEEEGRLLIRADYTALGDADEVIGPFLSAAGFLPQEAEGTGYYASVLGEVNGRAMRPAGRMPGMMSFAEASGQALRAAGEKALTGGRPLPEGGLLSPDVIPELSFCILSGETVEAYLAVEDAGEGTLKIAAIFSELGSVHAVVRLLCAAVEAASERYGPDTRILALITNPRIRRNFLFLFPQADPISRSLVKV